MSFSSIRRVANAPADPLAPHFCLVGQSARERASAGSVATSAIDRQPASRGAVGLDQVATWNNSAMKAAWALMSLPPIFRTCPFLIIAIASKPAGARRAVQKPPKPSPGRIRRLIRRWTTRPFRFPSPRAHSADLSLCVVFTVLPRTAPARPICFIRRAAWGDGLAPEPPPDPAYAVDLEVCLPNPPDNSLQCRIPPRSCALSSIHNVRLPRRRNAAS